MAEIKLDSPEDAALTALAWIQVVQSLELSGCTEVVPETVEEDGIWYARAYGDKEESLSEPA